MELLLLLLHLLVATSVAPVAVAAPVAAVASSTEYSSAKAGDTINSPMVGTFYSSHLQSLPHL